jgi:DNA mismatch repair protein MutS2
LKLAERREVERILRQLAAQVGARAEAIQESIERLARIDLALAKARLGRALGGTLARTIEPGDQARPSADLRDARHPALGPKAVPISVELGRHACALVISGPNTGGKTVALKTIGLLALMAQAGIPIPAGEGSSLKPFDGIYADIGDEQSIEQSLSTFSGHLRTIVEVLAVATPRSLVLLDELGAGTDPQEGSAIAQAILAELVRRRSTTVVTTHHSPLKSFASATPGVQNASVEFDAVTLAPTYHLVVGLPGRSNALAIAERLGLPASVLAEARAALGQDQAHVERLLAEVQEERRKAGAERATAEILRREADQARAEVDRRLAALEAERRDATDLYKVEVQVLAEELKSRLRHVRRRLNALVGEKGQQELSQISAEIEAVRTEMERGPWKEAPAAPALFEDGVRIGDLVKVEGIDHPVEVIAGPDERGRLEVQAGSIRLDVHRSRVRGKAQRPPPAPPPRIVVEKGATVGPEFWVHGMRAQQAVEAVDEYLEKAVLAGHHRVRIIHGKGRGILRSAIQRRLGDHPLVGLFHDATPDEGGEGVTIVEL